MEYLDIESSQSSRKREKYSIANFTSGVPLFENIPWLKGESHIRFRPKYLFIGILSFFILLTIIIREEISLPNKLLLIFISFGRFINYISLHDSESQETDCCSRILLNLKCNNLIFKKSIIDGNLVGVIIAHKRFLRSDHLEYVELPGLSNLEHFKAYVKSRKWIICENFKFSNFYYVGYVYDSCRETSDPFPLDQLNMITKRKLETTLGWQVFDKNLNQVSQSKKVLLQESYYQTYLDVFVKEQGISKDVELINNLYHLAKKGKYIVSKRFPHIKPAKLKRLYCCICKSFKMKCVYENQRWFKQACTVNLGKNYEDHSDKIIGLNPIDGTYEATRTSEIVHEIKTPYHNPFNDDLVDFKLGTPNKEAVTVKKLLIIDKELCRKDKSDFYNLKINDSEEIKKMMRSEENIKNAMYKKLKKREDIYQLKSKLTDLKEKLTKKKAFRIRSIKKTIKFNPEPIFNLKFDKDLTFEKVDDNYQIFLILLHNKKSKKFDKKDIYTREEFEKAFDNYKTNKHFRSYINFIRCKRGLSYLPFKKTLNNLCPSKIVKGLNKDYEEQIVNIQEVVSFKYNILKDKKLKKKLKSVKSLNDMKGTDIEIMNLFKEKTGFDPFILDEEGKKKLISHILLDSEIRHIDGTHRMVLIC